MSDRDVVEILRDVLDLLAVHRGASRTHPLWPEAFDAVDRAGLSLATDRKDRPPPLDPDLRQIIE